MPNPPLDANPHGCRLFLEADPPPEAEPPNGILRDTVNKWAVRILLECILVPYYIPFSSKAVVGEFQNH